MKSELPIGIFDSGIGGLTVAREIIKLMPKEQIIYFGDTLHLPYGEKSKQKVDDCCITICDFLIQKKCKAIVIACNTASSLSIEIIQKKIKNTCLLFNVIDPVIKTIKKINKKNKIGIIGTNATIKSNVYEKKIKRINQTISVCSLATPLLAPMIESGFHNESIKKKIIATYLKDPILNNITNLILGCTHYPLIKKQIENFYQKQITVISSLNSIGEYIKTELQKNNLLNPISSKKKHEFFVSDLTDSFQKSAELFFNEKIILKEKNIFL